jgi:Eco57I restriction-modification methylase
MTVALTSMSISTSWGLRLLRPGGRLSFVVTNKWLRAGYAENLRGLLSTDAWLEAVIDFGHAKNFFPAADVFPCVVVARRPDAGEAPADTAACQIPRDLVRLDRLPRRSQRCRSPRREWSSRAMPG